MEMALIAGRLDAVAPDADRPHLVRIRREHGQAAGGGFVPLPAKPPRQAQALITMR
jgi:hypothetical protein